MNIQETLLLHKKWLNGEADGVRADLRCASLRGADLRNADLRCADLRNADLRNADLRYVNLRCADLRCADLYDSDMYGANLSNADLNDSIGNSREIKTIQTDRWTVVYTETVMAIGCQQHPISEWLTFDDQIIEQMDYHALEFWHKWKPILTSIGVFAEVVK